VVIEQRVLSFCWLLRSFWLPSSVESGGEGSIDLGHSREVSSDVTGRLESELRNIAGIRQRRSPMQHSPIRTINPQFTLIVLVSPITVPKSGSLRLGTPESGESREVNPVDELLLHRVFKGSR
jgi:hypothetical protein